MRAADSVLAVAVILGVAAGACSAPTLTVEAEPKDARILIDGETRGVGSVTVRQPYYGVVRVEAVPAPAEFPEFRQVAEKLVELDPPVTGWLFPFDLLGEIVDYPTRAPDTRVELKAEPRQVPAQAERPPTDDLRSRALKTLTSR